jgi:hypothetical protein
MSVSNTSQTLADRDKKGYISHGQLLMHLQSENFVSANTCWYHEKHLKRNIQYSTDT